MIHESVTLVLTPYWWYATQNFALLSVGKIPDFGIAARIITSIVV